MVTGVGQLWRQAAAGDRAVFESFYRRHADAVFAHVRSRVDCQADAEDLTAEVFLIAWRRRRSVRVHASAGILPWLLATANNLLWKHYRTQTRHKRALPRPRPPFEQSDVLDDLVSLEDDRRMRDCLRASLDRLKPGERQIIELRFVHGMNYAVIGELLGLPVATARTRLHRALARARQYFVVLYGTDALSHSSTGGVKDHEHRR